MEFPGAASRVLPSEGGPSPAFSRKERGSEGVSPTSGDLPPEPQPDHAHRGKKSIAGCPTARQAVLMGSGQERPFVMPVPLAGNGGLRSKRVSRDAPLLRLEFFLSYSSVAELLHEFRQNRLVPRQVPLSFFSERDVDAVQARQLLGAVQSLAVPGVVFEPR